MIRGVYYTRNLREFFLNEYGIIENNFEKEGSINKKCNLSSVWRDGKGTGLQVRLAG
jgi:hypothetical protein